jgi:hypothetical protein
LLALLSTTTQMTRNLGAMVHDADAKSSSRL